MPSITKKVLARNVVITVTPQTEAAGALTDGVAFSMTGRCGEVSIESSNQTEDISGIDALNEDHVKLKKGTRITLEAIKHIAGVELEDIAMSSDYVKVVWTSPRRSGITDQVATRTYYGLIERHRWSLAAGKNVDNLSLVPIDISTANPAFAVA